MNIMHLLLDLVNDGIEVDIHISVRRRSVRQPVTAQPQEEHTVSCTHCKRWSGSYSNPQAAARALRSHRNHCSTYAKQVGWIEEMQAANSQETVTEDDD